MTLNKIVGVVAIAGALGLSPIGPEGEANAATTPPALPGAVQHAQLAGWGGPGPGGPGWHGPGPGGPGWHGPGPGGPGWHGPGPGGPGWGGPGGLGWRGPGWGGPGWGGPGWHPGWGGPGWGGPPPFPPPPCAFGICI